MQLNLSPMSVSIKVSATSYFNAIAKNIKSVDCPLISLAVGEPDYKPPIEVIKATGKAAEDGFYRYSAILGLESLRKLISDDYKNRKNVEYNVNEICLCNGATQAATEGLMGLLHPGEEVICPAPYWTSYVEMVKIAFGIPKVIQTHEENDFLLTPKQLNESITNNTKCIV